MLLVRRAGWQVTGHACQGSTAHRIENICAPRCCSLNMSLERIHTTVEGGQHVPHRLWRRPAIRRQTERLPHFVQIPAGCMPGRGVWAQNHGIWDPLGDRF